MTTTATVGIIPPIVTAVAKKVSIALEVPDSFLTLTSEVTWGIFGEGALLFEKALNAVVPSFVPWMNHISTTYSIPTRMPLPMLARPVDALFCVLCYFIALGIFYVISKMLGKHQYRYLGLIHNFILFSISLYMGIGFLASGIASDFPRLWNNPIADNRVDDEGWRLAKLGWVFTMSKLPEYGDTFLMTLKQNYRQLSFLHLYHHSSIFLWAFCILAGGCGGDIYWPSLVNSWVHVFMYGYYAGTLAFKEGKIRNALNSIKFFITKGQIIQFVLNMAQASYVVVSPISYYPLFLASGQIVYMVTMVALFSNFLLRNQGAAKKKGAADKKKDSGKESKKQK